MKNVALKPEAHSLLEDIKNKRTVDKPHINHTFGGIIYDLIVKAHAAECVNGKAKK